MSNAKEMDNLASLGHNSTNSHHPNLHQARHQQDGGGEDEFDEIVPMQLDHQPPGPGGAPWPQQQTAPPPPASSQQQQSSAYFPSAPSVQTPLLHPHPHQHHSQPGPPPILHPSLAQFGHQSQPLLVQQMSSAEYPPTHPQQQHQFDHHRPSQWHQFPASASSPHPPHPHQQPYQPNGATTHLLWHHPQMPQPLRKESMPALHFSAYFPSAPSVQTPLLHPHPHQHHSQPGPPPILHPSLAQFGHQSQPLLVQQMSSAEYPPTHPQQQHQFDHHRPSQWHQFPASASSPHPPHPHQQPYQPNGATTHLLWHHPQMPQPLRKESMPALHFNDQPYHLHNHHQHQQNSPMMGGEYVQLGGHHHHFGGGMAASTTTTERTRSMSTAMLFGSPSSAAHFPHHPPGGGHSPCGMAIMGLGPGGGQNAEDLRRTKSSVLPPTSCCPASRTPSASSLVHSLRRFHSQLRSPCRYSSAALGSTPPGCLPPWKPYTPPPILSPLRLGSGLFNGIGAPGQKDLKKSSLALITGNQSLLLGGGTALEEGGEEEGEGMLAMKEQNGHGHGGGMADDDGGEMAADEEEEEGGRAAEGNGGRGGGEEGAEEMPLKGNGTRKAGEEERAGGGRVKREMEEEEGEGAEQRQRPQRKNGTILFAADGPSGSGLSFSAELEQLRKQSSASHRSHKASMFGGRMSIRHGKLSVATAANDDFIRKMSSVSMEEVGGQPEGTTEEAPESDAIPHINLGKNYQARVKKWADRAISAQERAAIPDRDEQLFSAQSIEHIGQQALAAYETLACSVALPKSGRNKEMALHILAENQGNLQAAVMDLLRCDTLDWEQYPAVYNSRYVDTDVWSPEEILSFQDAIYKSEKDFQQVANELGNRTVHECVAFYYTWKKACPDDYRKLRNLRRKRQLLEQQLDLTSFDHRQPSQSEKSHGGGPASSEEGEDGGEEDEGDGDFSETESDITNPSLLGVAHQPMDCSPGQRKYSLPPPPPIAAPMPTSTTMDPLAVLLNPPSAALQGGHSLFNGNGAQTGTTTTTTGYPWLHGTDGIFPSPSSSSTSTNNNDNGIAANGAIGLFGSSQLSHERHGIEGENGGGGGGPHLFAPKIRHHHGHSAAKKGAQPQADGFFHCRLCEKRFEKVKSLNAHMKSHAMKARAEAEAQQKQQQQQQLAFPLPTKKDPLANLEPPTSNPLAGALAGSLGMSGLPSHAQAAMAALNNLGRQIQQQQHGQQSGGGPFGGVGANTGFGLLRNMLQYGQQHAPAPGAPGTPAVTAWPGLEQHFNA